MLPGTPPHNRLRVVAYFVVFLLLHIVVAYLNRYHLEQQVNFSQHYVRVVQYWKGEDTSLHITTYPIWGYSFILYLLPSYKLVIVPQVVLGAVAQTALFLRLRPIVSGHSYLLTALFIAAVPWYLVQSVKWPQSFAASLIVIAILLLDWALRNDSISAGFWAGIVFGLALYFRCEFLYLPFFFIALILAVRFIRKKVPPIPLRPAFACALAAWASLIPWAIYYYKETGHVSFTASQGGMVAFISLGQLPHNPWNAVYDDQYAYDYLYRLGMITVAPQSDEGDRVLMSEFKRRVRAHPLAFLEKAFLNIPVSLVGGFYNGEVTLTPEQQTELAHLKSSVKHVRWLRPGQEFRNTSERARMAFLFWVAAKGFGSLYVILSAIGLVWFPMRERLPSLLFLLWAYILYQGILLVALATEPRYLNGLYLAMVPFFLLPIAAALRKFRFSAVRSPFATPVRVGESH